MTNEELIAKIKAEIERRFIEYNKDSNHHLQAAEDAELLSFLDTLEESVKPMNQDEVVINGHKVSYDKDKDAITMGKIPNDLEEAAKKYAHCPFTDDDGNFHEDAFDVNAYHDFIAGYNLCKEQMMKKAWDTTVHLEPGANPIVTIGVGRFGLKVRDKVRVIVLPKEEEK